MIKYEMITGHFTAHRCLFGWNSMVVLEKPFSLSVRICMGIRLKKKTSYHCLPDKSSQTAQEQWQHSWMEGSKQQRSGQGITLMDPFPRTQLAASPEPGSFGYQGIPWLPVSRTVRLPAVQTAFSRFPPLAGSRQAQSAVTAWAQQRSSDSCHEPSLAPAALLRALVIAGPVCRQMGPLKHKPVLTGSTC